VPLAQEGDRVLLLSRRGRRFFVNLRRGDRFHTHKGVIEHDDMIGALYGRPIVTHLDETYYLMRPSIHDELMSLKRVTQIIYPKEIGQILLKLDVCSGRRVIEAGTGSGALTMALAHAVQPEGRVFSYEARPEMLAVALENLERVGLDGYVEFVERDISLGFCQADVDALFLDVREPWDYLRQASDALADGGHLGVLVPTTNQIVTLLQALARLSFVAIEVLEVLLRHYKPVPGRLRPEDTMVGHTGYLLFARKVASLADDDTDAEAMEEPDGEQAA
jgi:tRNA (adenine57-N1/adenine58-N1)-methyltransferase catalytic subunit